MPEKMSVADVANEKVLLESQLVALVNNFNRRTGAYVTRIVLESVIHKTMDGAFQYVLEKPDVTVQVLSPARSEQSATA